MGGLAEPLRDVVDLLAFAGELDIAGLAQLTGWTEFESAEASGLITDTDSSRRLTASPAHPLYSEVR